MEFIVSGIQFILILRDPGAAGERQEEFLPTGSFMVLVLYPSCCPEINQAGLTRLAHLQLLFDTLSLPCDRVCLAYVSPVSPAGVTMELVVKQYPSIVHSKVRPQC